MLASFFVSLQPLVRFVCLGLLGAPGRVRWVLGVLWGPGGVLGLLGGLVWVLLGWLGAPGWVCGGPGAVVFLALVRTRSGIHDFQSSFAFDNSPVFRFNSVPSKILFF